MGCDCWRSSTSYRVAWPHSNDSALALQALNRIGRDAKFDEGHYTVWSKYGTETRRVEHRFEADSPEFVTARQASWIAIENFVGRKWFRRLWVIRGIHLAKESVMTV